MRSRSIAPIVCGLVLGAVCPAWAGNWPGWRGPTGLGYTDEKDLPLKWDGKKGENIVWKVPIAGGPKAEFNAPGHSCPIIWDDRIFITTAFWPGETTEEKRKTTIAEHHVICHRKSDGEKLWDTIVKPGTIIVQNEYHGYAVPTPVTDGKLVYALFGSGVVAVLDFDGKVVWTRCRTSATPIREFAAARFCTTIWLLSQALLMSGCGPWTRPRAS